ncbi:uncharacterized protein LOC129243101 [Anastrepha obliqua]|uniref:uncharacterized protein LOC129243101 n=1 Tax=Anastrepha obliqua TaxID=95512 RepID=UPI00240A0D52|nr:uncharacterized protein LOC129243101 [Anastrepha obliqua]
MRSLLSYLLCISAVTLSTTAPQYVGPYATLPPQFSQLSSTPYIGYGQNIRIQPWVIGQYAYPNYLYYSNYWNNNNNPSSYPYNMNVPAYNGYNPPNPPNPPNPYNPYNMNTGTNTYWNGYAWVNNSSSMGR